MRKILLLMAATAISHLCWSQESQQRKEREEWTLPTWGIKTNVLYDATGTFNLGAELKTGARTSLDISGNYNPWTFSDNRKWEHILVQPEFRLWTRETFRGHFFGVHAHYAYYNVGGLDNPPFSDYMSLHRFEGWLVGAGIGYGYRWNLNRILALEAEIGVGYAYLNYDKYPCGHCGKKISGEVKNYVGPTKVALSLIYSFGAKQKQPAPVYIPPVVVEPPVIPYEPQLAVSFIMPEANMPKHGSKTGKAYLDFVVGKANIVPSYKNNAKELNKINDLICQVQNDPNTTITGITVRGYASPEGSYESNQLLSERRANALKEHLHTVYGFPYSLFRVEGRGEDWDTLEKLVKESGMDDTYLILETIRSTDVLKGREKKLMSLSGGVPYRRMKADLFPQLRRSEYELHYTVPPFDIAKGKETFKTSPGALSLNELFLIANTYEPGSNAFNEVLETAARIFPNDDEANLNAAAAALERKDTVSATRYLERVKEHTGAYWNNAGILAYMQDDLVKASGCFERSKSAGSADGSRNAEELLKSRK